MIDTETVPITSVRRRREEKHPVLMFIAKFWIGISTTASIAMALFLMLGFDFKTPSSWLEANKQATNQVITRVNDVEERVKVMETILIILARDACNRLTRQQLLVTPQCDLYVFPQRIR